ncbi:Adrenodoxin, mitochondrial [Halotydeus destructor]|nr:Adrenodoxin, mitochondrial [Halotydeus destructor]
MNRYLFGAAISCFNHVRLRNQFSRNTFKALGSSLTRNLSQSQIFQSQANFTVTFIRPNGDRIKATCKEGDNLLDVVLNNNIEIDGFGACEGTLSCSTCHLVLKQEDYDRINDKPTDEELDMLDLAYSLTDTSRLGCQIHMTKELDGLEVQIPEGINDVRMEN